MIFIDQHVHTSYSFDSNCDIRKYLDLLSNQNIDTFFVTEHVDFEENISNADINKQANEINKLKKEYPNINIYQGVEIGYRKRNIDIIHSFLDSHHFALINLSVHYYKGDDFYNTEMFYVHGIDKCLNSYLDIVYEAAKTVKDYDVLCHFDFAYKTALLINPNVDYHLYEDKIIRLFKLIIQKDKVLEINTKVHRFITDPTYLPYILHLYKSLGGKNICVSSDAHDTSFYRYDFEKYIQIIKDNGFDHLNYFINRKRFDYKI